MWKLSRLFWLVHISEVELEVPKTYSFLGCLSFILSAHLFSHFLVPLQFLFDRFLGSNGLRSPGGYQHMYFYRIPLQLQRNFALETPTSLRIIP